MNFVTTYCSLELRFSIGRELESNRYYLAIPVSNRYVDYEEYYALSAEQYAAFPADMALLNEFARRCKARECDDLLLIQAGSDRGIA